MPKIFRILNLILITLILFGVTLDFPHAELNCNTRYEDVPHQSYTCLYVNYLDYFNAIDTDEQYFNPNSNISKTEFISYIVKVFGLKADISNYERKPFFKDIKKSDKYFTDIYIAKKIGILDQNSNIFGKDDYVTRSEALMYTMKAAQYLNPQMVLVNKNTDYIDLNYTNPNYKYVQSAYNLSINLQKEKQILSLQDNKRFRPFDKITKFEASKIIVNAFLLSKEINNSMAEIKVMPTYTIYDSGYIIYYYENLGLTIISTTKSFDFLYNPYMAAQAQEYAQINNYKYIVNGSFYGGSWQSSSHAGFLNYFGYHYTHFKPSDASTQLTHIVQFNRNENILKFLDRNNFTTDNTDPDILEFQTGPLVMQNREIQYQFLNPSQNGNKKAVRTMLAKTSDKEKYFLITRQPVKIYELGDFLLTLKLFEGKSLDVINLDGGSSTALYSQNHPEINYYPSKRLPILIGLR